MTGTTSLHDLQAWMSVLIEHRQNSEAGARTKAARELIPFGVAVRGKVVLPNDRLDVFERLDIYNGGYFTRLKEVLESDHPALVHALGEATWLQLALGYCERYPSRHPNLNQFNKHLPDYIASRKGLPNRAFLRDLARLEVAMTEVFDAPEFEAFDMSRLADLTEEQWENVVFVPNPSLRLLATSYPVNDYLQAVFDDGTPTIPARKNSWLALYRQDYQIIRLTMTRPMFTVLESLCGGTPFAQALAVAPAGEQQVGQWFQMWSADGLFADVAF